VANRSTPIRLGIIGCGKVSWERHMPALLHTREFEVTATADPDAGRSEWLAGKLGAPHRMTGYRALLDLPEVDAVGILTPTSSHAEITLAALDSGKHVLVEKPLALTVAECDRLAARASSSPCKVVVGFNLRWHRLVRRARAFIAAGALGRIKAIRCVYTHDRTGETAPDWHRKLELGGGVTFNEGVHHFDLWRHLGGGGIEEVFAYSNPSSRYEDETSNVTARMSDGVLATAVLSLRTGPNSEVEIFGDLGRLCLSLYRFDGMEFHPHSTYPGNLAGRVKKTLSSLASLPQAIPIMRRGGDFQATFSGLWEHFADCILRDQPSDCTLEDGRSGIEAALAAIESFRSGRPVRLQRRGS